MLCVAKAHTTIWALLHAYPMLTFACLSHGDQPESCPRTVDFGIGKYPMNGNLIKRRVHAAPPGLLLRLPLYSSVRVRVSCSPYRIWKSKSPSWGEAGWFRNWSGRNSELYFSGHLPAHLWCLWFEILCETSLGHVEQKMGHIDFSPRAKDVWV